MIDFSHKKQKNEKIIDLVVSKWITSSFISMCDRRLDSRCSASVRITGKETQNALVEVALENQIVFASVALVLFDYWEREMNVCPDSICATEKKEAHSEVSSLIIAMRNAKNDGFTQAVIRIKKEEQ